MSEYRPVKRRLTELDAELPGSIVLHSSDDAHGDQGVICRLSEAAVEIATILFGRKTRDSVCDSGGTQYKLSYNLRMPTYLPRYLDRWVGMQRSLRRTFLVWISRSTRHLHLTCTCTRCTKRSSSSETARGPPHGFTHCSDVHMPESLGVSTFIPPHRVPYRTSSSTISLIHGRHHT